MGLLDFSLPKAMRGEVSSIAPTPAFAGRVHELGITLGDFGRDEREEVLVLTRNAGTRAAPIRDRVEYEDTAGDQRTAERGEEGECVPRGGGHRVFA